MLPSVLWGCFLVCLFGKQQHSNKEKQEVHEFYSADNNQEVIANEFPQATREDYTVVGGERSCILTVHHLILRAHILRFLFS